LSHYTSLLPFACHPQFLLLLPCLWLKTFLTDTQLSNLCVTNFSLRIMWQFLNTIRSWHQQTQVIQ
jgi:hypothetical protein